MDIGIEIKKSKSVDGNGDRIINGNEESKIIPKSDPL